MLADLEIGRGISPLSSQQLGFGCTGWKEKQWKAGEDAGGEKRLYGGRRKTTRCETEATRIILAVLPKICKYIRRSVLVTD